MGRGLEGARTGHEQAGSTGKAARLILVSPAKVVALGAGLLVRHRGSRATVDAKASCGSRTASFDRRIAEASTRNPGTVVG